MGSLRGNKVYGCESCGVPSVSNDQYFHSVVLHI